MEIETKNLSNCNENQLYLIMALTFHHWIEYISITLNVLSRLQRNEVY